jgi:putative ABC transport system permease protein
MLLLGAFAAVAVMLAAIGISAVVANAVVRRTREIGVRMALGAGRRDVLGLVLRQGMLLVAIGLVAGLAGALALTRVLRSLLYGVSPTDLVTFAGVPLLLAAIALVAAYLPARRAAQVDPMVALRSE